MNHRTPVAHAVVALAFAALLQGCSSSNEPASVATASHTAIVAALPLDCPAERVARVPDLHASGSPCSAAREQVGANLKSHHYRVACEAIQGSRPDAVLAVQATACREDDRGAWTDVEICCPVPSASAEPSPRKFRLKVAAPAVGKYGTASVSLGSPPSPTDYRVKIAPESCDVYQLHPDGSCEFSGSYATGQTSTFMVRYTPGSTHRRGGVMAIDFLDPELSDVEVTLSGGVDSGESDWLSVPIEPR